MILLLASSTGLHLVLAHHQQQLQHHQGLHLVQRIHKSALQPLGYGGAGMAEAQLVEDVIHAIRLDGLPGPREQAHRGLQVPGLALKVPPVAHKRFEIKAGRRGLRLAIGGIVWSCRSSGCRCGSGGGS